MKQEQRFIIINSAILFVIASVLAMTIHEFGHFFASILVNAQQLSIHHNYTSNSGGGLSSTSMIFIKSTGPLVSLMIGVVFHYMCSRQAKRSIIFLFEAYMALFGYIGFFGYLIIAPLTPGGDTGYVFYSLGLPVWAMIILAMGGAVVLYFLINILMKYFVEMGSREIMENGEKRQIFIRSLIFLPMIIGIVVTTILNLPVPSYISLIAPVCGSLTILCGYNTASEKTFSLKNINGGFDQINKFNLIWVVFFVLTIIMNRLLVLGIYVN
jgi:hypothetical protein